jgi:hypothetical protein
LQKRYLRFGKGETDEPIPLTAGGAKVRRIVKLNHRQNQTGVRAVENKIHMLL